MESQEQPKQNYLVFLWKHLTSGQKFGIGALLLLLLVFPIAVIVALLPTNPFSRAGGTPTTPTAGATTVLYFNPDDTDQNVLMLNPGETLSVDVMIDSQLNTVSAVRAAVAFADELLEYQSITLSDYLPTQLETPYIQENIYADEVRFTVGSTPDGPKQGVGKLATITFKVLPVPASGDGSNGEGSILYNPSSTEVAAIGEDGNVLQFMRDVFFKVNNTPPTITPTVTPTPTDGPTPTPTDVPTPTPTEAPNSANLNIMFKLDTVTAKANDLDLTATLEMQNCPDNSGCVTINEEVTASNGDNGTYTAVVPNIAIGSNNEYKVFIKPAGFLRKLVGAITLVTGTNLITGDPATGGISMTPGDLNGNGEVDIYDFTTVIEDYGLTNSPADFNKNGEVDIYDFTSVVEFFGTTGD